MAGKLRRVLCMPVRDLFTAVIRTGGTWAFRAVVVTARRVGIPPRAYDPTCDPPGILVVTLTPHLGDAVMLLPMLQALKLAHPATPIDVAIEAGAASLLDHSADLRTVYRLRLGSEPPVGTAATIRRIAAVAREYWRHMRGCRPSICIMPRWGDDLFRSFYLALLTGAPRRIGFAASVGWPRYRLAPYRDLLLTEAVQGGCGLHEPARFIHLLEQANLVRGEQHRLTASEPQPAMFALAASVCFRSLAARLRLEGKGEFAVIAPGASQPKKMWPVESWCTVVRGLAHRGFHTVLLSGALDSHVAERIHRTAPGLTTMAAGTTTFAESAALMQHAAVFLGSDSGPAHMAGALGTPAIVLFSASAAADPDDPFSPERNRPMGQHVHVLQPAACLPPCITTCEAIAAHCIRQITPDSVLEAVEATRRERVSL